MPVRNRRALRVAARVRRRQANARGDDILRAIQAAASLAGFGQRERVIARSAVIEHTLGRSVVRLVRCGLGRHRPASAWLPPHRPRSRTRSEPHRGRTLALVGSQVRGGTRRALGGSRECCFRLGAGAVQRPRRHCSSCLKGVVKTRRSRPRTVPPTHGLRTSEQQAKRGAKTPRDSAPRLVDISDVGQESEQDTKRDGRAEIPQPHWDLRPSRHGRRVPRVRCLHACAFACPQQSSRERAGLRLSMRRSTASAEP
jgi:hypothetical protein